MFSARPFLYQEGSARNGCRRHIEKRGKQAQPQENPAALLAGKRTLNPRRHRQQCSQQHAGQEPEHDVGVGQDQPLPNQQDEELARHGEQRNGQRGQRGFFKLRAEAECIEHQRQRFRAEGQK